MYPVILVQCMCVKVEFRRGNDVLHTSIKHFPHPYEQLHAATETEAAAPQNGEEKRMYKNKQQKFMTYKK